MVVRGLQVHHPETETKELVRGTQRICHAWMPLLPSTTTKLPPAPASGSARLKERRAERVEKPEDIKEGLDSVYESKLSPRRSLSVDQKPAPPHPHKPPLCTLVFPPIPCPNYRTSFLFINHHPRIKDLINC